ncbi:MAG TPA: DUF1232 domain-containing protein [bacterium]|nr:DUF1232 domain-containing protein [bacterium]
MRETELSPEQMAKRLGISNMTIRRWMEKKSGEALPAIYEKSVWDAVYQMVAEGMLLPGSTFVQKAVKESQKLYFSAAMKSLGFKGPSRKSPRFSMRSVMEGLSQIGAKEGHQSEVEKHRKKILSFVRLGQDWKQRISTLIKVVSSTRLSGKDKLVAYGALFYLLCPLDLIPDNVPVFGLMDDYCVLGFAASHYAEKYKILFG